jgi:hypothetical protein
MDYAEARSKIKTGDLVALTHSAWASLYDLQVQAVRIGTQSEYCHVCVAWVIGGRVFVIESVEPVVRIFPMSNFEDHGFYWIPTDVPMSSEELEFGLARVGLGKYSKVQAVEGQLNILRIGEDELWMCAELTIAMRRLSGLDLGPKATPAAVVKRAQELGYPTFFVLTNKTSE